MKATRYAAPWSGKVVTATLVCVSISVGAVAARWSSLSSGEIGDAWYALTPAIVLFGAALFTVRGYSVTRECINVKRLLWSTRLPRDQLQSASVETEALRGSRRTFGNGGVFGLVGWFKSAGVGSYRAFATDLNNGVVLRYPHRTIVVSPADPQSFVKEIEDGVSA